MLHNNHANVFFSLLDKNCNEYLKLAELAGNSSSSNIEGRTACLQLKMTALVPTDILAQLTIFIENCKVQNIIFFKKMQLMQCIYSRRAKRNLK
jgi:hypothetical protein